MIKPAVMRFVVHGLLACCVLLGVAMVVQAEQELTIQITEGRDNATPIAVVPFAWKGQVSLPEDIAAIIAADLSRSGQFNPLPRGDMLSRPSRKQDVFFRDWRILGSEYLVIGRVDPAGPNRYELTYELFDVFKGESYGKPETIAFTDFRKVAHFASDRIYERLTGTRGAFSTQILYITYDRVGPKDHLYRLQLADSDGHKALTILESSEPIMSPTWSPDGRRLAYVSFHEQGRPGIFIQDIYTGKRTKLTAFKGVNGAPDWSPDGQKMAMSLSKDGNLEIYIMDLNTRQLRRMTNHYAIDTEPRWSGDGNKIIFTSDRGGGPQIYEMNVKNGSVRRLTFEGNYNARGTLTPDDRYLVMVHRANGLFHVAVQDLELGTFKILTQTALDESPSVAPNGAMLLYATRHLGQGILGAVSLDGRAKFRLPSKRGEVREPSWSPFLN